MMLKVESESRRTFPPHHASALPFPAFHLRCRVPKISKLAASFLPSVLPGHPLKFSHCFEWSLQWDWERRCFLSVQVKVAVASPLIGQRKFFAVLICIILGILDVLAVCYSRLSMGGKGGRESEIDRSKGSTQHRMITLLQRLLRGHRRSCTVSHCANV